MVVKGHKGFTLIELIFAIVIIAISVVSLPTMVQVTSSGVGKNIETQEAIFKAIVLTKSAVGENSFTSIDNIAQTTPTAVSDTIGLEEYKFNQTYTLTVDANATFNSETSADIKKITTKIFDENSVLVASFSAYKFNY